MQIKDLLLILKISNVDLKEENNEIEYLLTDSRQVIFPKMSLFFAIVGERHDGHIFIEELYQKGVRNFVVQYIDFQEDKYKNANFFVVQNSIEALQKVAQFHRGKLNIPIIAITGSNGKTIVKEWLATFLAEYLLVIKSPKSYNSQIGVPLSIWNLKNYHQIGIFEAGISKPQEMENLAKIIQPTIGIFTNIGSAHDEGFENRKEKIKEKLKLFDNAKKLIYCIDYQDITTEINQSNVLSKTTKVSWTTQNNTQATYIFRLENKENHTICHYKNETFLLPFTDFASIENILHCLTFLLEEIKIESKKFNQIIENQKIQPISMRLSLKRGMKENYLIDDTYNNDLAGLKIALDFLQTKKKLAHQNIVIISDILESNLTEKQLYEQVCTLLQNAEIDVVIGIGEAIYLHQNIFHQFKNALFFVDTDAFLDTLIDFQFKESLILIKGARKFQFEKIVKRLQQKTHQTLLEINLDALIENLNFYRSLLQKNTKIMVMVKAFAYGAGRIEVAHLLQSQRVDYLAVAYADEGVELRKNGITIPIMVMNPNSETFDNLFEYQLEPEIYSWKILQDFLNFVEKKQSKDFKIHIKLDTGMKRLGFLPNEIQKLAHLLAQKLPFYASIASIFSHLAGADSEEHNHFSRQQIDVFTKNAAILEDELGYSTTKHILNSAGIIRFPEAHFDMVRLGIGLYGVETNDIFQNKLKPIATLKTTISQIKEVKKGESVGYARSQFIEKDGKIGVINIGYADGFNRLLSNGIGEVWVNGKLAKVVGRICMDMSMIDLSEIEAQEGDEVIIFGQEISIQTLAQQLNTIPYEILTSVGERVKRVFYKE
jgi:alanine racemase